MKKIKSIAIVWEQSSWGGVESFTGCLLNNKVFKDTEFTIITNKNNKGLDRLKVLLKENKKVDFVEYDSLLLPNSKNYFVPEVYGGINEIECSKMIKNFFKKKR